MDRSHDAWLWLAGACVAVGVAFLGISAALVAAKPPTSHAHWATTWEAYVAYGFFVAGGMCFVTGIRGARFPLIGQPRSSGAVLSVALFRHERVTEIRHRGTRTKKRKNSWVDGTAGIESGRSGSRGCSSRVETAPLPLMIARHEGGRATREATGAAGRGRASDPTHSRVASAGRRGAVQQSAGQRDRQLPRRAAWPEPQPTCAGRATQRLERGDRR